MKQKSQEFTQESRYDKFSKETQVAALNKGYVELKGETAEVFTADERTQDIQLTPKRHLDIMLIAQRHKIESIEAEDWSLSEHCTQHTLMAILSGLEAAHADRALDDASSTMSRLEAKGHKEVVSQFNQHLHDSLFYADGELADQYEEIFIGYQAAIARDLGVNSGLDRASLLSRIEGIKYEVAFHHALAYPSHWEGGDYDVQGSSVEEDLKGIDLKLVYQIDGEGEAYTYAIDVKKKGSFIKKAENFGYSVDSALSDGYVEAGSEKRNHCTEVVNGEAFGPLRRFKYSDTGRQKLRDFVFERMLEQTTRDTAVYS